MSSVTLKNVFKVFNGGVTAVSDFSLDIQDKEFIILVGPSGCGKTTTLRMIAGLESITKGEIYIDNKLINNVPSKDRDIAMVFQNYALYPHMTVFENISFGMRIRKMPRSEIKRRVLDAAAILELSDLLDRKPAELSGGQRQRVALGRAIVRNPKVFLLDEPLSNLDAKLRTNMRAEISKLHERLGTTFIYVTHDQTEAMTMGTRIVVMKDGFVQQIAPPHELYRKPANLFVSTFIGSPQMNILEGVLLIDGDTLCLDFGHSKSIRLCLPDDRKTPTVMEFLNKKVIFGIRPHDIHLTSELFRGVKSTSFKCDLDFTELLGAEQNLYLKADGVLLNAVVPGSLELAGHSTA